MEGESTGRTSVWQDGLTGARQKRVRISVERQMCKAVTGALILPARIRSRYDRKGIDGGLQIGKATREGKTRKQVTEMDSLDDIVIIQLLQETDLSNGRAGHALILCLETNLLQRDDLVVVDVASLVHHSVCT